MVEQDAVMWSQKLIRLIQYGIHQNKGIKYPQGTSEGENNKYATSEGKYQEMKQRWTSDIA